FDFQPFSLHPQPSSFPTRRSSDLERRSSGRIAKPLYAARNNPLRYVDSIASALLKAVAPFETAARSTWPALQRANQPTRRVEIADRKSTRLNSSHEWISYAVFCLK